MPNRESRQEAVGHNIAQAAPGGTATVVSYQYVPPQPVSDEALRAADRTLATLPVDIVPPTGGLPAGSRVALAANPLFTGRKDELRFLADGFVGQGRVQAVTGLGGIGKTQLAAEFTHRYGPYFTGGVFWLGCSDSDAIPGEIAACGGPGGLDLRPDFGSLDFEDRVRLVLAAWQSALPRLLVLDDCEDEELLARWRPPTGGCRVLVTSRRGNWDPVLGVRTLGLDVMRRPESRELLGRYRADLPARAAEADALAAELGDLPLALHMAGSFLARYRNVLTLAAYLTQLRGISPLAHASLEKAGISPTGHVQNVGRTFALSHQQLNPADPVDALALAMLERLACFVPRENVPRQLLNRSAGVDPNDPEAPLHAEDALRRLAELGLVQLQPAGARMHRLVAAFVTARRTDGDGQTAVEEALLLALREANDLGDARTALSLEPHMRAVTDAALERADQMAVYLGHELGRHLSHSGSLADEAVYFPKRALEIDERLHGVGAPATALSVNNLGHAYLRVGRGDEAREFLERALPLWEALGNDAERAATLDNLGQVAKAQGHYVEARLRYEEALSLRERVLGPDHPSTAVSLHTLGSLLMANGALDNALLLLERALRIREVLPPDHIQPANTQIVLAQLHFLRGDLGTSRALYEEALRVFEKRQGADSEAVLSIIGSLMVIAEEQCNSAADTDVEGGADAGVCADAERQRARWEEMRDRLLATGRRGLGISFNNVGFYMWDRGYYGWAAGAYLDAAAVEERDQGPISPTLATTFNNLGMVREREAAHEEAAAYFERALGIQHRAGRSSDGLTGRILNNYGVTLGSLGCLTEARQRLDEALILRRRIHGEDHRDTALTLSNRAAVRYVQGEPAAALADAEWAVALCGRCVGDTAPGYALCLHILGLLLLAEGRITAARSTLEQALRIRRTGLPERHADTADTLRALGRTVASEGGRARAAALLAEAVQIYARRLGADHATTRAVRNELERHRGAG